MIYNKTKPRISYVGRVLPTTQGRTYNIKGINDHFTQYIVAAACKENRGIWFCITDSQSFLNQFEKNSHISQGTHELAWLCFTHGPEVP